MHAKQIAGLILAINNFSKAVGTTLSEKVDLDSKLVMAWLSYLKSFHLTGVADNLILAVESSIRETAACLSLGLVRPALFSLRMEIDLVLAWLYFKDHAVEWNYVNASGDGFKMKKEILDYLAAHNPRFQARLSQLKNIKTRIEADPYRLLSAHIHGQSAVVLPAVHELQDFVRSPEICFDSAAAIFEVSEYINDVLLSMYVSGWHALPKEICIALEARFVSPQQQGEFFA